MSKVAEKTTMTMGHDRLFKAAMGDIRVARDFFRQHLPSAIAVAIDWDSLMLSPNSYVDNSLKSTMSDVLYQAIIAGENGFLVLLAEHQSTPDPLMAFRVWQYTIAIWHDHIKQTQSKKLPLVVPLVFYHGQAPYNQPLDLRELIQAPKVLIDQILYQPFQLVDTHKLADESLLRDHIWSGIFTFFMKHVFVRDFLPYLKESLATLRQLEQSGARDYVNLLLHYAVNKAEINNIDSLVDTVQQDLSSTTGNQIMTIAEQLIQRGEQRGLQQGIQQGIQQGEYALFMRQLKRKFGVVPSVYLAQIETADEEQLLTWGERFVDANTLNDIFQDDKS